MFRQLNRYVGFPNQIYVDSKFTFDSFEKSFKGKLPFFVSTFPFKDKDTPIINNLFFDIDSYLSLRLPWRNVKLLRNWCYKKDIPSITDFSGQKGFHFLIMTKPVIPKTEKEKDDIRKLMYSIQTALTKELGVEAFDDPTFGRIRFLIRFPTSLYIRKDEDTGAFKTNELYCRYLEDEEFDAGVKKIAKVAREPGVIPKPIKSDFSLEDIANEIKGFKLIDRGNNHGEIQERIFLQRAGMTVPTIEALGLPCLKEIVKHSHPTHYERVEVVSWLKHLGYTDAAINMFIKQRNWTRYKSVVTAYQVRTIKPRRVRCSFLRENYSNCCKNCHFNRWK